MHDEDLIQLFDKVLKNIEDSLEAFEKNDYALAQHILEREVEIDSMVKMLRKKYISIMNSGIGKVADGVLFIDTAANLERMSDRTVHMTKYVLAERYGTEAISVEESINPIIQ